MTIHGSTRHDDVVDDRYQIESLVGEGGAATVYRALDLSTGRRVALKRLSPGDPKSRDAVVALFQNEFLVLSQLSHPRIVAAYNYGVTEHGPYYTMELLDGADLQRLSPLPYRRVCALGHDVCSALALIHSRRLVYRDLSPKNVRCTADGLAKLIDFGALAPMGPRRELVGTLPCVAPEVVAQKPLDARTDLYALGASLYFTLVRRHAYPARSLNDLLELWKVRPPLPSELVPDVPRALDLLIRDLMDPEPARRPQSAAEVMERLRAIGQLEIDESLQVKSAYLSQPALVGRDDVMQTFHEHATRAAVQQGSTLRISGESGVGLSRLLGAFRLQAKLSGWLVVHADPNMEGGADYAGAAALGRTLLEESPRLSRTHAEPHLSVLGHVIPELIEGRTDLVLEQFASPEARHRRVQPALRGWLARVAQDRPLLVTVDDVQRMDAPSAALVTLLAREAKNQRMLIAVAQSSEEAPAPHNAGVLRMLARVATDIEIAPLSHELTRSLLGSVFGDVPNLELVSHYVHHVTAGNPRDVVALSRHLVAEAVVRYEAGSWSLPNRFSATDLPPSMADALKQRAQVLSPAARTVAYALSREPSLAFSFDDVKLVAAGASLREVALALQELLAAEILSLSGNHYRCAQRSWITPLANVVSEAEQRAAQLGLARIFLLREDGFRHARWLLGAGEHERALAAMTEFALTSLAETNKSATAFHALLRSLPEDWLMTCEEALALYDQHHRPLRERFALLSRMTGFMSRAGHEIVGFAHVAELLKQLAHDSGLDCFAELASDLPPATRLHQALGLAERRYRAQDAHTRVFAPGVAVPELVRVMVMAMGSIATTSDYAAFRSLPSLAPLVPLGAGIELAHQMAQGLGHRLVARTEESLSIYGALLQRLDAPNRAGLDPAHHFHTKTRVIGAVGALEAAMGRASCTHWAELVDNQPGYDHVGALIRYLYHLWQGNPSEARRFRRQFELLELETNANMDLQHVFSELCVYALVSDMTGVRRAVDTIENLAPTNLAARATAHYGRGEYHFIRGDAAAALDELRRSLAMMAAGEHLVWANAAGAHVRVLMALDRHDEARELGEAYLVDAETQRLSHAVNYIRCPLALALSKLGQHERARELAAKAVAVCTALRISGLNAYLAYETSVIVALAAGEPAEAERNAEHCSGQFRLALARRSEESDLRRPLVSPEETMSNLSTSHDLEAAFATCLLERHSLAERALAGLEFMTRHLGAKGGVVYVRRGDDLLRVAASGEHDDDAILRPWTLVHMEREEAAQATEILTEAEGVESQARSGAPRLSERPQAPKLDSYIPIPLAHYDEAGFALTGIVAVRGASQAYLGEAFKLGVELSRLLRECGEGRDSRPPR